MTEQATTLTSAAAARGELAMEAVAVSKATGALDAITPAWAKAMDRAVALYERARQLPVPKELARERT